MRLSPCCAKGHLNLHVLMRLLGSITRVYCSAIFSCVHEATRHINGPTRNTACNRARHPLPATAARFITGLTTESDIPAKGTSLDGLLNQTSLMDVPFRAFQRQETLIYLAAMDDPSAIDDPDSRVAFQSYPSQSSEYYAHFNDVSDGCSRNAMQVRNARPRPIKRDIAGCLRKDLTEHFLRNVVAAALLASAFDLNTSDRIATRRFNCTSLLHLVLSTNQLST